MIVGTGKMVLLKTEICSNSSKALETQDSEQDFWSFHLKVFWKEIFAQNYLKKPRRLLNNCDLKQTIWQKTLKYWKSFPLILQNPLSPIVNVAYRKVILDLAFSKLQHIQSFPDLYKILSKISYKRFSAKTLQITEKPWLIYTA